MDFVKEYFKKVERIRKFFGQDDDILKNGNEYILSGIKRLEQVLSLWEGKEIPEKEQEEIVKLYNSVGQQTSLLFDKTTKRPQTEDEIEALGEIEAIKKRPSLHSFDSPRGAGNNIVTNIYKTGLRRMHDGTTLLGLKIVIEKESSGEPNDMFVYDAWTDTSVEDMHVEVINDRITLGNMFARPNVEKGMRDKFGYISRRSAETRDEDEKNATLLYGEESAIGRVYARASGQKVFVKEIGKRKIGDKIVSMYIYLEEDRPNEPKIIYGDISLDKDDLHYQGRVINDLLDSDRVNAAIEAKGGYIGYISGRSYRTSVDNFLDGYFKEEATRSGSVR